MNQTNTSKTTKPRPRIGRPPRLMGNIRTAGRCKVLGEIVADYLRGEDLDRCQRASVLRRAAELLGVTGGGPKA